MIQYQIKYIAHNDRIKTCYLHANSREEVEESVRVLQGCKQLISIRVWPKNRRTANESN